MTVSQLSTDMIIQNFQKEDFPLLGELYQSVTVKANATFWWVGKEANWSNRGCIRTGTLEKAWACEVFTDTSIGISKIA